MTSDVGKREHNNPHHRCTHSARQRDGSEVKCSDVGSWTLDKAAKTWRPARPADKSRRCWAHGPGAETKPVGKGGRRRRRQPNARVNRAAGLLGQLAPLVTDAIDGCGDELALLGYPSSSDRGTNWLAGDSDPVGGDVARILELTDWRDSVRDVIDEIESGVDELVRLVNVVLKRKYAHGVKLCAENQQGRAGSIEWGDPTCTELPVKDGLCSPCYLRERRWSDERHRAQAG